MTNGSNKIQKTKSSLTTSTSAKLSSKIKKKYSKPKLLSDSSKQTLADTGMSRIGSEK